MYEIAHYMGANTQGTANLLQAILDTKAEIRQARRRFIDVDLRRRQVPVLECGEVAPRAAAAGAVEGQALGDAVSGVRTRTDAARHRRIEASAVHLDLRA